MTTYDLLLDYLSAFNKHDSQKLVRFLHPDCRVMYNDQVILQGIEAMRPTYEKDFLDAQLNVTRVKYDQDRTDSNRIRALLKLNDKRLIDVTYVFETEETEGEQRRMIEHLIHSVTRQ